MPRSPDDGWLRAGQIAGYPSVVLADGTPPSEALRRMVGSQDHVAVVASEDGSYGVLTESDVVRVAASVFATDTPLCGSGEHPVVVVPGSTSVAEARDMLRGRGLRYLFVVREGHAVGVVGVHDLGIVGDAVATACADVMTSPLVFERAPLRASLAAQIMTNRGIGSVGIQEVGGEIVDVVTRRDLAVAFSHWLDLAGAGYSLAAAR